MSDLVNCEHISESSIRRLLYELEKQNNWFHRIEIEIETHPNGTVRLFKYKRYIPWEIAVLAFGVAVLALGVIGGIAYFNPMIFNSVKEFLSYAIVCLGPPQVNKILKAK